MSTSPSPMGVGGQRGAKLERAGSLTRGPPLQSRVVAV
jgi:hypothetical protein